MKVKGIVDEDFVQYKKPSMFIIMPNCSFKCDKECGKPVCQNSDLAAAPIIDINSVELVDRFYNNPITEAVIFGGLEPFDSFDEMHELISILWEIYNCAYGIKKAPDIVIYTGYYPVEIEDKLKMLKFCKNSDLRIDKDMNIIIKFGRFIPNSTPIHDDLLGVDLASCNQKAMKLEDCV